MQRGIVVSNGIFYIKKEKGGDFQVKGTWVRVYLPKNAGIV